MMIPIEEAEHSLKDFYLSAVLKDIEKQSIKEKKKNPGRVRVIHRGGGIPYQVKQAKHGRNEQCPCGSGKKYKKCCMTKEQNE